MRAIEPEAPKPEEVEPVEEVGPPNTKAGQAALQKKDPSPPAPYRYCMPTHAVYTPPKPTARIFFLTKKNYSKKSFVANNNIEKFY